MPVLVDSTTPDEDKDEWRTDPLLFELCNREFKFNLDVAASDENTLCDTWYTKEDNALKRNWGMVRQLTNVWCNPPFSLKHDFLQKGIEEHEKGVNCCFLVPADAPETSWWLHAAYDTTYPVGGTWLWRPRFHVRNLRPRVNYYTPDGLHKKGNNRPSALIVMGWNQPPGVFTWTWKNEAIARGLIKLRGE